MRACTTAVREVFAPSAWSVDHGHGDAALGQYGGGGKPGGAGTC